MESSKQSNGKITARREKQFCLRETQAIQGTRTALMFKILKESSSEEEHKVNALASGAEEGRDKLRKAAVSCK